MYALTEKCVFLFQSYHHVKVILTVTIKAPALMVPAHAIMVGRDPVTVQVSQRDLLVVVNIK